MGVHPLEVYSHFAPDHSFDFRGNLPCWVVREATGELEMLPGRSNAEIMGIPKDWPGTWVEIRLTRNLKRLVRL
jgi:hypothetical protein